METQDLDLPIAHCHCLLVGTVKSDDLYLALVLCKQSPLTGKWELERLSWLIEVLIVISDLTQIVAWGAAAVSSCSVFF